MRAGSRGCLTLGTPLRVGRCGPPGARPNSQGARVCLNAPPVCGQHQVRPWGWGSPAVAPAAGRQENSMRARLQVPAAAVWGRGRSMGGECTHTPHPRPWPAQGVGRGTKNNPRGGPKAGSCRMSVNSSPGRPPLAASAEAGEQPQQGRAGAGRGRAIPGGLRCDPQGAGANPWPPLGVQEHARDENAHTPGGWHQSRTARCPSIPPRTPAIARERRQAQRAGAGHGGRRGPEGAGGVEGQTPSGRR